MNALGRRVERLEAGNPDRIGRFIVCRMPATFSAWETAAFLAGEIGSIDNRRDLILAEPHDGEPELIEVIESRQRLEDVLDQLN